MRARAAFVALAILCGATVSAQAESATLSGQALRTALAGKTVYLNTPLGVALPIRYRRNGTMSGRANGALAQHTGSRRDTGRWWIRGNRLCQRWNAWLDGRSYCFSFSRSGRTVRWRRSDGRTGTATIAN